MTDAINALHTAYCSTVGVELPQMPYHRYWYDADKLGLTPADLIIAISVRQKQNRSANGSFKYSLAIKHLVGDEDRIADTINCAALFRAEQRRKTFNPGKAEVLRATGRPDAPESKPAQSVEQIMANIVKLKGAVNE